MKREAFEGVRDSKFRTYIWRRASYHKSEACAGCLKGFLAVLRAASWSVIHWTNPARGAPPRRVSSYERSLASRAGR